LPARACRAVDQRLLRHARRVISASGRIRRGWPVVVTVAGTPWIRVHLPATSASASGGRADSSGSGCMARTDRQASVRLSLASWVASSMC
jgi:hypothetical protein